MEFGVYLVLWLIIVIISNMNARAPRRPRPRGRALAAGFDPQGVGGRYSSGGWSDDAGVVGAGSREDACRDGESSGPCGDYGGGDYGGGDSGGGGGGDGGG